MNMPVIDMERAPLRVLHRFSVDDYYRMAETGILDRDIRTELLDGQVVEKSPSGSRHAACIRNLTRSLYDLFDDNVIVSVQAPVRIGDTSELEPDIALLRPRSDRYMDAHPGPDDVLLVVEVADSSLEKDRSVKLPLYAEAGVREVWIVDIMAQSAHKFTKPKNGVFQEVETVSSTGSLSIDSFPEISIDLKAIFG